ncbi:hypothetical protein D3C73_1508600 [compost metagenome]
MINQSDDPANLFLNLLRQNKQMRIVLTKSTHPHHPVKRTGKFMPMYLTKFRQPDWQFSVGS